MSTITLYMKATLRCIIQYRDKHQYSPSMREIAKGMGYKNTETAVSAIKKSIDMLVEQGYLTSVGFIPRSYIPTEKAAHEFAPDTVKWRSENGADE